MAAIQAANIPKSRSTFLLNFITDDTQLTARTAPSHPLPNPSPKGRGDSRLVSSLPPPLAGEGRGGGTLFLPASQ